MSRLKEKIKKYQFLIILLGLGLLASSFIYKTWIEHQAKTKDVVQRETGLTLPSGIDVQKAQVQLFSFVDGVNYDWILSGSTSLVPWARSVGKREGPSRIEGWSHVKTFQEICPFQDPAFEQIGLHSVWRIAGALPDKKATCFLYIAEDEKTGLLSTFNP